MAQRIFNSTLPFSMSTNQPKLKVHTGLASNPEPQLAVTSAKDEKPHHLTDYSIIFKIISHGTAKHVGTGPLGTEKPSIIAQAECESQDSQEFCPNSRHKNVYSNYRPALSLPQGSVSHRQPRKKRRKRQRQRVSQREGQHRDAGSEKEREKRLTRVPEQDSGELGGCSYISSNSSSAFSTESLSVQETAESCCTHQPDLITTQLSSKSWEYLFTPPHSLVSYSQESECSLNRDSPFISEAECSLALAGLRNNVSQAECSFASAFAKQMVRDLKDREGEEDAEEGTKESETNEGILFKEELQPQDYEYRERRDYELGDLLKQGSFGVVYTIRDKSSGFVCAAKKVPLERFRSEEVGSWSVLQSPHIVEFFGFVREGRSVILFMDFKPGSLGQLLAERGRLPEDLSMHYMHQVLGALEHLHKRRILHLDVKVDNVLLSEDGKNTFLCDFGESERLDLYGFSPFQALKGTETHMAPEVARGEKRCAKVDVWSSCCMFLHMLNGCQPWARYYSRPLYLKIAEEPPPLREIPPDCSPHTADIIKLGLQKDPSRRSSAKDLRNQTAKALKQLGGLRSPARGGAYQKPIEKPERCVRSPFSDSSVQQWMGPGQERRERAGLKAKTKCSKQEAGKVSEVKEENEKEEEIVLRKESYFAPSTPIYSHSPPPESHPKPTEQELRKLEREFFLSSLSQPHSVELQEQLLSCLGSDCLSSKEHGDKKDSGRWSLGPGDDLSSGVFSYNSQSDGQSFSMDWLGPAHQPPPRCFEGVDVCIRDFNGRCLRIRETPRVKVGHIAVGISDQISESVFSLQSEDGSLVPHDKQVQEAGLFLRCVPAPDPAHRSQHRQGSCCNMPWSWRIRDGRLETWD
ncbi:Mitogen-activated protein kinase kinase kinase 14 [Bagarius yarrelli]|uniref:Mitogen-activated protein kinase kinase kinase 14 n=1 Tax=Bagarius yarrelli TaxID=175774 RepID=A0A556TNC7_BAGYA|nr:Mitogen-activated protein kinase kinase kinase 14 [Bagarius yarrelli]